MNKIKLLLILGVLLSTHSVNAGIFERFVFEIPYGYDYDYSPEAQVASYGANTVVFEQDGYTISVIHKKTLLLKNGNEKKPFFMKHIGNDIDMVELIRDNNRSPVFIAVYSGNKTLNFVQRSRLGELQMFLNRDKYRANI